MAYYRRKSGFRYSGGSSYRRKGGRRTYSRYGKKRYTGKKRSKSTPASSSMSIRKMREQIQRMSLVQHGEPRKYALNGGPESIETHILGSDAQRYYLTAPVSEVLQMAARSGGNRSSVYVTGVVLELDLLHSSAVDFFALCFPIAGAGEVQLITLNDKLNGFKLGALVPSGNGAQMGLCGRDDESVESISRSVFSENARDGSLFNASLRTGMSLGGQSMLNGKGKVAHTGRVSMSLSRKGDEMNSVGKYVRESIRVWWDVNKLVRVLDSVDAKSPVDYYSILCGVRPQADMPGLKAEEGFNSNFGMVRNLRVTVHVRQ